MTNFNDSSNEILSVSQNILADVSEVLGSLTDNAFNVSKFAKDYWHEKRIDYLVFTKNIEPISLDVGCFYFNCNFIQDGYHRIAAAIYRNDFYVPAMFSGSLNLIKSFMSGELH